MSSWPQARYEAPTHPLRRLVFGAVFNEIADGAMMVVIIANIFTMFLVRLLCRPFHGISPPCVYHIISFLC